MPGPLEPRSAARDASLLRALADQTRLRMVALLGAQRGPLCACEIEARFHLAQATISHHLRVLRAAGLIDGVRRGTWIYYTLDRRPLRRARELLDALERPRGD